MRVLTRNSLSPGFFQKLPHEGVDLFHGVESHVHEPCETEQKPENFQFCFQFWGRSFMEGCVNRVALKPCFKTLRFQHSAEKGSSPESAVQVSPSPPKAKRNVILTRA